MVKILDITYVNSYLKQVADNSSQMNVEDKNLLLSLLGDFEDLFGGTLGDWSTEPANLELKPYSKPFNIRYYPVPRINRENFRKELKRLLEIGVLTPVQQSQYSTPVFIVPKKEGTVRCIMYYCMLNKQLFRNPYPLPIIGDTMQQLEGFQYATSLYLNMGHYNISLSPTSQDMTTIVTEFGKFKYNRLPMGMCASGDIFRSKVDELLGDIEGVKTYIHDIIVVGKDSFENHIDHLRIIFVILHTAGLKVNATKCSFGLN